MARRFRTELRDRILASAATEFAQRGFHPVPLDDVAARCGVTKGGIYFHFRGKMDLFLLALDRLEAMRDEGRPAPGDDPLGTVAALLRSRLDFHATHPELRRLYQVLDTELRHEPAAAARDGIRAEYRSLRADLRQLLQQAARRGLADLLDPAAEAFRLAACLEGTLAQQAASPDDIAHFWDVERLVAGWIAPIVPAGPPPAAPQRPRDEAGEDFQPAF